MKYSGPYLRQNFPKVYFTLIGILNSIKKIISSYKIYISDSLGGSFKDYIQRSDQAKIISELKRNLDKESIDTIDVILQRLIYYPDEKDKHKTLKHKEIAGGLLPVESRQARENIDRELRILGKKLSFPLKDMEGSVFYFFHGLTLLPVEVAKYIEDQDFIDAGAFSGDSAIALKKYKYKKIYSIELSQKSIERYKVNLLRCNISKDKFETINAAIVSDDIKTPLKIADTGLAGFSLKRQTGKYDEISVQQKSLDSIVNEYNISPRFIKADIEGNCLDLVRGAQRTLITYRPVLSLAIYHNPMEFFEVKPFLEEILNDYLFMIRKLTPGIKNNQCHSEVVLIGYPREIIR